MWLWYVDFRINLYLLAISLSLLIGLIDLLHVLAKVTLLIFLLKLSHFHAFWQRILVLLLIHLGIIFSLNLINHIVQQIFINVYCLFHRRALRRFFIWFCNAYQVFIWLFLYELSGVGSWSSFRRHFGFRCCSKLSHHYTLNLCKLLAWNTRLW